MTSKVPTLIEKFGKQKCWVNWVLETREGKTTKVPLGSSTDKDTWSTYDDLPNKENIGLMFGLKKLLLGIDIDHCLENGIIVGERTQAITKLLAEANTYTEVSPSGTGLHLFVELEEPLDLISNRKDGYECYTTGRYFTVTNKPYGTDKPVRKVSADVANDLLKIIGYPWKKEPAKPRKQTTTASAASLDDDTILKKMFASKAGDKIKALYNGDISAYGNDESSADMALCSHLSFWFGGNADKIEAIWLSSPLGARGKTQDRKDYRDRTIQNALAGTTEFYTPSPTVVSKQLEKDLDLDLLFTLTKDGDKRFTQNMENICRVLRKHPNFAGTLRYDVFKNVYEIKDGNIWRDLQDIDALHIQSDISIMFSYFQKVGKEMVYDAIIKVAKEREIDSALDYVKSIKWDGVARLDTWLGSVYGTPDDEYHRKVGSNWFKGMVKRIVEPGCKFDHVLVLEGKQGSKKSTSLAVLGRDWHIETTMSTDTKDFFMQFLGNIIVEFSEGETLSRTEVKRMKAIITTQSDKFRMPYERTVRSFPRRCVFAMTTNQEEYLKDETGNRRWLPVKLVFENANIEWLKANRDQLFAEAYHRVVNLQETTYEFPVDETEAEQAKRQVQDANAETIAEWYYQGLSEQDRMAGITVSQVYKVALNNNFGGSMTKSSEMGIANVLKNYLKLEKVQVMRNGIRTVRWYKEAAHAELGMVSSAQYLEEFAKQDDI